MRKYSKQIILVTFLLIFASWFSHNIKADLPRIFQKDLIAHDESSNSVVSANITRQFFPPMVRTNPLVEEQGNWMEGPYWQHIPPLFTYVPYVFFELDGRISIEVKRLSYAFITLLTGLLFITIIYLYSKNLMAAFAALVASIFWLETPFTKDLISGNVFGASDIVLAFTSVCALGGLFWYLNQEHTRRLDYSWKRLALIAFLPILPIWTKNLLGAIPAAGLVTLILIDHRKITRQLWQVLISFAAFFAIYYLPLFLSSPDAFKKEILIAFFHAGNYEGWGRPMFYYFTNYLPLNYLGKWIWIFWVGLAGTILALGARIKSKESRMQKGTVLVALPLVWFVLNLVVISFVTSKIPNFIYQSYLFAIFAIVWTIVSYADQWKLEQFNTRFWRTGILAIGGLVLLFTIRSFYRLDTRLSAQRAQAYTYGTEREKFYQLGNWMQRNGVTSKDLTIVRVSDNDCWLRYDILFLTGAESKTLLEMNFMDSYGQKIKDKYNRVFFVMNKSEKVPASLPAYQRVEVPNYSVIQFNLNNVSAEQLQNLVQAFVSVHQKGIQADIERIKDDKTSCQWLVPDAILNAD